MAIRDLSKKPYIEDRDDRIFIGIDLPFRKSNGKEGWFASTTTTIESVKNNIRNLLSTHKGERLFQPMIGLNLRKYIFSQIDHDLNQQITNEIIDTFKMWLPFVIVDGLNIIQNENKLSINLDFHITKNPNTLDSVTIEIGE